MNHTLTRQRVQRICTDGVLIALYFVLTTFSLRMGNLRITFASLIVIVATLLFSTLDACLIAMLGELLNQVLQYGLTVTTPMWLLPPAIRALVLGLFFYVARKFGIFSPARKPVLMYAACITAALCTTFANTLATYIDSKLFHYYSFAYVFGDLLLRIGTGVLTAVIMATIAMPLVTLLRPVFSKRKATSTQS